MVITIIWQILDSSAMFQNDQVSLGAELATEPGRWQNIQQQIATEYDADDFCHPGAEVHSRELDTVLALARIQSSDADSTMKVKLKLELENTNAP